MIRRLTAAAALMGLATAATAEPFLTDRAYCDQPLAAAFAADVTALFATGTETVEYGCTWDAPVDLAAPGDTPVTMLGYCASPDEVWPTVFTLFADSVAPGTFSLFYSDGDGTPDVFFDCSKSTP